MSNLEQPLHRFPDATVENVYSIPLQYDEEPAADFASQGAMEDLLVDRLRPDAQAEAGGIITVHTHDETVRTVLPRYEGVNYYLGGENRERGKHWRWATTLFIGANAAWNALNGNVSAAANDTVEQVQVVKDDLEDALGIGDTRVTVLEPGESTATERTATEILRFESAGQGQRAGEAVADQRVVDRILDSIAEHAERNEVLVGAEFSGISSDDWRDDPVRNGFGHENGQGNEDNAGIATHRLLLTTQRLRETADARGIDLTQATFEAREKVLEETDILAIENAVVANGFDHYENVDEAVDAVLLVYNTDPASLPDALRDVLAVRLPRGFEARLEFSQAGTTSSEEAAETERTMKVPDGNPENKQRDYDFPLIPLVLAPLPIFRRKFLEQARFEEIIIPPKMPDPEYLKLYPAAKTEQDALVQEAWAYARKYQHMMRDGRVSGAYRLNYEDGEGNPQRLRAMFVDHEPTPDVLARVAGLLQTISQMQDGRVGREIDMITVYPSENAGRRHGDPKKIGLGQDIQFEGAVLGVAYPSLRLAELHMPPATASGDLGAYNSPDWVLAHEVGGHFTDLNEEDNQLTATGQVLSNGAQVYETNNRWADAAHANYAAARAEEQNGQPSRWQVHRGVLNTRGEVVEMVHDITDPERQPSRWRAVNALHRVAHAFRNPNGGAMYTGDPRLAESVRVTKETGHPTGYGGTSAGEQYAEVAASKLVGPIPFDQAHDGQGIVTREDEGFVRGYEAAERDQRLVSNRWGSNPDVPDVAFTDPAGQPVQPPDWEHWYGAPEADAELLELMNEARRTPVPPDEELVHVVTGRRI